MRGRRYAIILKLQTISTVLIGKNAAEKKSTNGKKAKLTSQIGNPVQIRNGPAAVISEYASRHIQPAGF